jgi:hypothetical protein
MIFLNPGKERAVGEANEKTRLDPEDAKVLPAREALSLISGWHSGGGEEISSGEEPPGFGDGRSEGVDGTSLRAVPAPNVKA